MKDDNIKEKLLESAYISAANEKPNPKLGITKEYCRNNYDSKEDKDKFKQEVFDGKQTFYSTIEGKTLHISHKAARKKYHYKNAEDQIISSKWAKYAAETDHRIPIKTAHTILKVCPFLSDNDLKVIINCPENYVIISKLLNTHKNDNDNFKAIFQNEDIPIQGRIKQFIDDADNIPKVAFKTINQINKNVISEFAEGANDAYRSSAGRIGEFAAEKIVNLADGTESLTDVAVETLEIGTKIGINGGVSKLTADRLNGLEINKNLPDEIKTLEMAAVTSTFRNGVEYISGDITELEALKNIAIDTGTTVAVDVGTKIIENSCTVLAEKAANQTAKKVLGEIASKSAGVALFVADTAKSFYRFLNLDITSEEFINEVRNNSIQTVSAFIGTIIAKQFIPSSVISDLVGGFIGYLIGAGIQKAISWFNGNEHARELERYYNKLTDELIQKRIQLEKMLQDMLDEKSTTISNGFISLHNALINSDNDKIDQSLEMIISEFGGKLRFESQQAFDDFMLSDEPLFI